jgi:putative hydrolase of the HAD superfamily
VGLLLCDLDDTLLDRARAFGQWAESFAEQNGDRCAVPWLREQDQDGYKPRSEFFAAIRARFESAGSVEELTASFYEQLTGLLRLEIPVRRCLESLRSEGWRIAIVTNGSPNQANKIRATGLDELVDAWCVSSLEGWRKPDGRLFALAAQRCGVPLDGAWVVGDGPDSDIEGAHQLSLPSVWLSRGRVWDREKFRPTRVADSFEVATSILLRAEKYEH